MMSKPIINLDKLEDVRKLNARPMSQAVAEFRQRKKLILLTPARDCTHEQWRLKNKCPDNRAEDDAFRVGEISTDWTTLQIQENYLRRQFQEENQNAINMSLSSFMEMLFEFFSGDPPTSKYKLDKWKMGLEVFSDLINQHKALKVRAKKLLKELTTGHKKWFIGAVRYEEDNPGRIPPNEIILQSIRYSYARATLKPELMMVYTGSKDWLQKLSGVRKLWNRKQFALENDHRRLINTWRGAYLFVLSLIFISMLIRKDHLVDEMESFFLRYLFVMLSIHFFKLFRV